MPALEMLARVFEEYYRRTGGHPGNLLGPGSCDPAICAPFAFHLLAIITVLAIADRAERAAAYSVGAGGCQFLGRMVTSRHRVATTDSVVRPSDSVTRQ